MSLPVLTPESTMSKVILPSSSLASSVTDDKFPFGIYLNAQYWEATQVTAFQSGAAEQTAYTYTRLGGDILDIELTEKQVFSSYEEACLEYSYIINSHQARNLMPFVLGQKTGSFNQDGQLTGSDLSGSAQVELKFPKMQFTYVRNIANATSNEVSMGGFDPIYSASFNVNELQQDYDLDQILKSAVQANPALPYSSSLTEKRAIITKVFYKTPGASWNFYGYFGGLNVVGNLHTYGQYADDSTFEVIPAWQNKLQAMAYEDAIKVRLSDYSFTLRNNQLRLYPIPKSSGPNIMWFEFKFPSDAWKSSTAEGLGSDGVDGINNMNTVPLQNLPFDKINSIGKRWIRRFALALCKEMLGHVRSKFGDIPIPGKSVNLNGKDLISEGKEEQKTLRDELKANLDEMLYTKVGEQSAKMAKDADETQKYTPMLIFVG